MPKIRQYPPIADVFLVGNDQLQSEFVVGAVIEPDSSMPTTARIFLGEVSGTGFVCSIDAAGAIINHLQAAIYDALTAREVTRKR